jgi:hypothetical protein
VVAQHRIAFKETTNMSQNAWTRVGPPPARRWPGRGAGLIAAVAGIAFVAAACGSGNGSTTGSAGSNPAPDTQQQALAYSQCMQSHGDSGFPDPAQVPGGGWGYRDTPQTAQYLTGPGYGAAQRSCHKLEPDENLTPAEQRAVLDQLLKLAACMRAHGITNFPDPTTSGGGVGIAISKDSGIDVSSPQFQAAQKACHMPGI